MSPWIVAVRAALPSPRPQGWQAFQQAVGLAEAGVSSVTLVGDPGMLEGVPPDLAGWLGRPLPPALVVVRPGRPHRPPMAGVLFRRNLARHRSRASVLLCRDPRVAAAQAGRWRRVLMEWHVRPDPTRHRAALAGADQHVTVAAGLAEDLREAGVPAARILLLPNACGLDPARAAARTRGEGFVVAIGLHRRGGLDQALDAWRVDPELPPLHIAGADQDGVRTGVWRESIQLDPLLRGRILLVGPAWGEAREALLDRASVWLALYPRDPDTETRLCPLQVADAAGSGLPLVTSDLPSIRAMLVGVPAGYAPPDDPSALAARVKEAVRSGRPALDPRPSWADRAHCLLEASP